VFDFPVAKVVRNLEVGIDEKPGVEPPSFKRLSHCEPG
jgi:hypothetical protein